MQVSVNKILTPPLNVLAIFMTYGLVIGVIDYISRQGPGESYIGFFFNFPTHAITARIISEVITAGSIIPGPVPQVVLFLKAVLASMVTWALIGFVPYFYFRALRSE